MSEFCVICAAPRSGTTFLSDALERTYGVVCPGEIFHEGHAHASTDFRHAADQQDRANFFSFRADAVRDDAELLFPTIAARQRLFDRYLANLQAVCPGTRYLIDVKYNSWHHLDGYWRGPTDPPGLLEVVRARGIPIIHLVRRNLFALYCSQQMAERSNIWSIEKTRGGTRAYGLDRPGAAGPRSSDAPPAGLAIDVEHCRRWMTDMAATQQQFTAWLEGDATFTLSYEDVISDGRFAPAVYAVVARALGCRTDREMTTVFAKILPPLGRVVENADAVWRYFADTAFGPFVRTALDRDAVR